MKISALAYILLVLLITSCSVAKYNESTVVKPDYGEIRFIGDSNKLDISLNGIKIELNSLKDINVFELKTGIYTLEIRSKGKLIRSEKILISNSTTNEVKLP